MKKKVEIELRRISSNIPKEYLDKLMKEVEQFPVSKEIMEKALNDPEVDEETKKKFKSVLESGMLIKKVQIIDEEVEKKISEFVESEIEKSIKLGRLPKRPKKGLSIKDLLKKKRKQDEINKRRTTKSI